MFECYSSMWDVIYFSELGSSWTVLAAGYTIESLMLRYQGVDWTNLDNWDCNARSLPLRLSLPAPPRALVHCRSAWLISFELLKSLVRRDTGCAWLCKIRTNPQP